MDSLKRGSRRTEAGREYARLILDQTVADEVTQHPNPVLRRLQEQARAGVSSMPGCLPPQVFIHLMDRLHGKVVDKVKLAVGGARAYDHYTNEELAARADALSRALRGAPALLEGEVA
jgi:hypothetical protein